MSEHYQSATDLSPQQKRALLARRLRRASWVSRTAPLSFAQQRLWLLDQLEPGQAAYNLPMAWRLSGRLNVVALEQTLNTIVERHDILRTTFTANDGIPQQVVAPHQPLTLSVTDLRPLSATAREAALQRLATQQAAQPFDLARGPLWRFALLPLTDTEHVFLFTPHHIIFDGWSVEVLWRELSALYEAYVKGQSAALANLSIQYADVAEWEQQTYATDASWQADLTYWRHQLRGSLPVLHLPSDRPRPARQHFRGAHQSFQLSPQLTADLLRLSHAQGATLFMTLLAAFQTLLYRYTGQPDLLVGTPVSGRMRVETEDLIGLFVNTVVLRTRLEGNPRFTELLQQVRETALAAYAHQTLPFGSLVEALAPERDLSRNPLFQVMFVFHNTPLPTRKLFDLAITPVAIESGMSMFDMTLSMRDTPHGLRGVFEYSTELFDATTVTRLQWHLQRILESVSANPARRLADVPLLTANERYQMLVAWNDTATDEPSEVCLHGLFEARVARTPEAVAVVYEGEVLTYQALNRRANQLAHHLQALGVRLETPVGLCMPPSLDMVVGLLAILKAGGSVVPLEPSAPPARLADMLTDSRAPVLLTQSHGFPTLPTHGPVVVRLDAEWPIIARCSEQNPASQAMADTLAWLLYTSGSTGRPKGVLGSQRAMANVLAWLWRTFPFASDEVCCQKTAISFVDALQELFMPLLHGIKTVIVPDNARQDPAQLIQILAEHGVTRLLLVPSLLAAILDTGEDLPHRLPRLTLWIASGEPLSRDLWQRFRDRLPQGRLINLYGASEDAADVTWFDTVHMDKPQLWVPIGRPIANTRVYLLDRHLQPVPIGVSGEIHVDGVGLARGYHNHPDLTAERFIPHPFSGQPGARLYKTGDLARYLPDGNLAFLGRLDQQVKLRGFRIEAAEIEAALVQHPAIRQAAVVPQSTPSGDRLLVAYLVVEQQPAPALSDLHRFLTPMLPAYMMPADCVMLNALPQTTGGKVDRTALLPPDPARSARDVDFIEPHTPTEELLADIWAEVLEVDRVGIHDNFFALGGHSLRAVRVISRLHRTTRLAIPLRCLFEMPTVAALADHVETIWWAAQGRPMALRDGQQEREEGVL